MSIYRNILIGLFLLGGPIFINGTEKKFRKEQEKWEKALELGKKVIKEKGNYPKWKVKERTLQKIMTLQLSPENKKEIIEAVNQDKTEVIEKREKKLNRWGASMREARWYVHILAALTIPESYKATYRTNAEFVNIWHDNDQRMSKPYKISKSIGITLNQFMLPIALLVITYVLYRDQNTCNKHELKELEEAKEKLQQLCERNIKELDEMATKKV